jgi:hypothetical protein
MGYSKKYILQGFSAIIILLFVSFTDVVPERPQTGFWAMEGTLKIHIFEEKTDSLSGPELFELQDENGLTIWFGRHIFKDVCISGECKMIRLWMFWDGAGNYLGIQVPEEEPLTKSDHTPFEPEDYEKLEGILRDTASILKDLKQEDLIIVPDTIDPYMAYEVDGYTAATQPALADVVVKDAVYSCHTLWHTVYGPVQNAIHEILENRINKEFLALMFNSKNQAYISWAIGSTEKFPEYHKTLYGKILECIQAENQPLANQALAYFQPALLTDSVIQNQLVQVIPGVDMKIKYEILWKLTGLKKVNESVVLKLLDMFEKETLGVGALNLIYHLVSNEHLNDNQEIAQALIHLSEHENGYVRNLTQRLLNERKAPVSN